MKTLMMVMLCAAALLTAGSAQAYAIFNHTNYKVCIKWEYGMGTFCLDPGGSHHEHGADLKHAQASYTFKIGRHRSGEFSIPKYGNARITDRRIEIFTQSGKRIKTVRIEKLYY